VNNTKRPGRGGPAKEPPMAIESQCNFMQFTQHCGCGVELSAADFPQFLLSLPTSRDPRLLAGPTTFDDAAVYRLTSDFFLVHTTVNKGLGCVVRIPTRRLGVLMSVVVATMAFGVEVAPLTPAAIRLPGILTQHDSGLSSDKRRVRVGPDCLRPTMAESRPQQQTEPMIGVREKSYGFMET
jgi:hypothetical protein